MAVNPITQTALQGIQRGLRSMRRNAAEIASAPPAPTEKVPTKDTVRSLVELRQGSSQVAASVKAFQTANDIIGSLLDVKA